MPDKKQLREEELLCLMVECSALWRQGIVEFYSLRVPHSSADTDRLASPSPHFVPSRMPACGMVLHTVRGVIPQSKPLWKQLHRHIWK